MKQTSKLKYWFFSIASFCTIVSYSNCATAEIIPDKTLPNNSKVKVEGNKSTIEGGTTTGTNLFHSFEKFGVPTGGEAHFNNAIDIQNIITRVTGKSISDIDGLIKANGAANLFLINPNGIIFGENARLDIGGSFVGSTANAIGFGEDNFFSATDPENSSSLLKVKPDALFFNQINSQATIESNSYLEDAGTNAAGSRARGLRVRDGKSLLLVGGDINIDLGELYAFGGRVELGGLSSEGTVGLNSDGNNFSLSFPKGVDRSNVTLSNQATVNVRAGDGGSIAINGRNFEMSGESWLLAGIDRGLGSEQSRAGNINVNVTDEINLNGSFITNWVLEGASGQGGDVNLSTNTLLIEAGGQVSTSTFGSGSGGNLTINTNTLRVQYGAQVSANTLGKGKGGNLTVYAGDVQVIGGSEDGIPSGLFASTQHDSTGNAGDLTINTNTLRVQDGAQISTGTLGKGKGGNLTINTNTLRVQDRGKINANTLGNGKGGNLTINTNTLRVEDGAQVGTGTFGEGNGGKLTVKAQDVQLIGTSKDAQVATGLFGSAQLDSTGNAGDLTINTNTLRVEDGAQVGTSTFGEGKGGKLTVKAQDVQLIGTSKDGQFTTGFFASTYHSTGNAGDLTINTNTLRVEDGAQVSTGTFGEGKGGKLNVKAQDVQLIGTSKNGQFSSGLFVKADSGSTANAGDLTINTNILRVQDGAKVSASTFGSGSGGNLTVDAGDVQLIGTSKDGQFPSGLFTQANSNSTGNAGDLTINTNTLRVEDGAQVNAGTFGKGKGGNLTVKAKDVQLIGTIKDSQFPSGLFVSTQPDSIGDAGNLTINTNTLRVQDGALVGTNTFGEGNGGKLTVKAQDVQLIGTSKDGQLASGLSASTQPDSTGNAGDLTINTNTLRVEDGAQVATGTFGAGNGGNLTVYAGDVQLIGTSKDGQTYSGLFASTLSDSTGNAGDLTINTDILQVENGATVAVKSFTTEGTAGELTINANSIRLNNDALLTADTRSNKVDPQEQATININSQNLIMRRGSNIFTNATGKDVIGGNINIDTDFLIANENSDISANSANFRGGNVRIDAQGIFGTDFRNQPSTTTSDITATGANPELDGSVEINTPQTDPNNGLVKLPTIPAEAEVANACSTPGYAQSSFTITGKGSLPPSPFKPLTGSLNRTSLATLDGVEEVNPQTTRSTQAPKQKQEIKQIVDARGWVRTPDGKIILVAHATQNTNFQGIKKFARCKSMKN